MKPVATLTAAALTVLAMAHNPVQAASNRSDFVVQQLYAFNHPLAAQLPGEVATKMSKMAVSAFAFYRGTAHLFYQDMATLPASSFCHAACNQTWLDGDMHLQNLGAFRDAAGNFVFDTNDFDESYFGPYVWDVRRMATSIILAARENGLSSGDQQQLVRDFLDSYTSKINEFHGTDNEIGYRLTSSNTSGVVKDTIQSANGQSVASFLGKYTSVVNGVRQFQSGSDLVKPSSADYNAIKAAVASYVATIPASKRYAASFYTVKDIRQKLGSGIGSLGRYRYYVLLEGASSSNADDVIVQLKQEGPSVVAIANNGNFPPAGYGYHEGQRVAKSMKANLSNTDVLVGWTSINGAPYLVREKAAYDTDFDTTKLTAYGSFSSALGYVGKVLAKNHANADKDYDASLNPYSIDKEIDDLISANKSAFKDEIVNFAIDYANQVQLDYQAFYSAWSQGVTLY